MVVAVIGMLSAAKVVATFRHGWRALVIRVCRDPSRRSEARLSGRALEQALLGGPVLEAAYIRAPDVGRREPVTA
jgi:hypothetical protein